MRRHSRQPMSPRKVELEQTRELGVTFRYTLLELETQGGTMLYTRQLWESSIQLARVPRASYLEGLSFEGHGDEALAF
jgi:hypothetical protein